jgi:hypothetical protein
MSLERVIEKLKRAKCDTFLDKKNVDVNIKICEMQIKIIDKQINNKNKPSIMKQYIKDFKKFTLNEQKLDYRKGNVEAAAQMFIKALKGLGTDEEGAATAIKMLENADDFNNFNKYLKDTTEYDFKEWFEGDFTTKEKQPIQSFIQNHSPEANIILNHLKAIGAPQKGISVAPPPVEYSNMGPFTGVSR